ncbi:MAG TPA: high-potential iron-sulfur protein [Gammaproteobacteria bacterium]|nr:high-potential iron-sulfur protein [Gammaproteobacteria bacterium]
MDDSRDNKITRRSLLKSAALLAGVSAVPGVLLSPEAQAAKASKAAMQYRTHPNGKHECSNCMHFIPGSSPSANGKCTVVAGSISPHGWCIAYAAKQS